MHGREGMCRAAWDGTVFGAPHLPGCPFASRPTVSSRGSRRLSTGAVSDGVDIQPRQRSPISRSRPVLAGSGQHRAGAPTAVFSARPGWPGWSRLRLAGGIGPRAGRAGCAAFRVRCPAGAGIGRRGGSRVGGLGCRRHRGAAAGGRRAAGRAERGPSGLDRRDADGGAGRAPIAGGRRWRAVVGGRVPTGSGAWAAARRRDTAADRPVADRRRPDDGIPFAVGPDRVRLQRNRARAGVAAPAEGFAAPIQRAAVRVIADQALAGAAPRAFARASARPLAPATRAFAPAVARAGGDRWGVDGDRRGAWRAGGS